MPRMSNLPSPVTSQIHLRKTDSVLIIPHGSRRGQPATSRTITSWLLVLSRRPIPSSNLRLLKSIRAHSTGAVATSWAAFCGISPDTIGRAATWSSQHILDSHYRVDSALLATVDFGRSVLRANSSAL